MGPQHLIEVIVACRQRRLIDLRTRVQQQASARAVLGGGDAMPMVHGTLDHPTHGSPVEITVSHLQRRAIAEHLMQHVRIAVKGNGFNGEGDMIFTLDGDLISSLVIA